MLTNELNLFKLHNHTFIAFHQLQWTKTFLPAVKETWKVDQWSTWSPLSESPNLCIESTTGAPATPKIAPHLAPFFAPFSFHSILLAPFWVASQIFYCADCQSGRSAEGMVSQHRFWPSPLSSVQLGVSILPSSSLAVTSIVNHAGFSWIVWSSQAQSRCASDRAHSSGRQRKTRPMWRLRIADAPSEAPKAHPSHLQSCDRWDNAFACIGWKMSHLQSNSICSSRPCIAFADRDTSKQFQRISSESIGCNKWCCTRFHRRIVTVTVFTLHHTE